MSRARQRQMRNVAPQRVLEENAPAVSQLVPATADFRALTSDHAGRRGHAFHAGPARDCFLDAPAASAGMIFGCLMNVEALSDLWRDALPDNTTPGFRPRALDDKARPVATQPAGENGRDWKRPFVASEIGEALPHWEAALYLMRPRAVAGKRAQRPPHPGAFHRRGARRDRVRRLGRCSPMRAGSLRWPSRKPISFPMCRTS